MPRPRRWTDEQLADAVAESTSMSEVCRRIGILPGRYDLLRTHIARIGVDASHLPRASTRSPRTHRRYTDEQLVEAVRTEISVTGVLRRLGYTPNGGMFRAVSGHIRNLGLDTTHFTGQAWAGGRKFPRRGALPLEQVLVRNSTYSYSAKLRRRLVDAGLKPDHCEECGLREWRGQPLTLALDHVNGDHTDNRLDNLRILCPNCHALTDTWCARNRKPA